MSISGMPAGPPKLPSIWKGGCVSNMFGSAVFWSSNCTFSYAISAPRRRAEKLIIHAQLQPVCPPPCREAVFERLACRCHVFGCCAGGELTARMHLFKCEMCLWAGSGSQDGCAYSSERPSWPIFGQARLLNASST